MDSQCYFWHNDQFDISLRPKVTSNTGSSLFWQPLVKAIRSSSCDTGRDGLNMLLGRPQTRFLLATVSHEPKHQYHPVSPTPTFTNKALQCNHYKRMFMDKFQLQGSPFSHKSDPGNFPKRMAVDGEAHDSKPVGLFVRPGSVRRRCEVPLMLRGGLGTMTMTASKSECTETISHWIGLYKEKIMKPRSLRWPVILIQVYIVFYQLFPHHPSFKSRKFLNRNLVLEICFQGSQRPQPNAQHQKGSPCNDFHPKWPARVVTQLGAGHTCSASNIKGRKN